MNNKLLASVFMLLTLVGITMATVFYFKLQANKEKLAQRNKELEVEKAKQDTLIHNLNATNHTLNKLDSAYQEVLKECEIARDKVNELKDKSINSKYLIGINSVGIGSAKHNQLLNHFRNKGYTILFDKPRAKSITTNNEAAILYYSNSAEVIEKVNEIKKDLKVITGKNYELMKGDSRKDPKSIIIQNI